MKKNLLLITFLLVSVLLSFSQKKELTIEDAVSGQWRQFYPEHLSGVMPYGNNDFTFVKDYK